MPTASLHVKEIFRRIAAGDEQAFTNAYYQYSKLIYPFFLNKVKEEAIALELVQDVFLKVWQNREKLAELEAPDAYLFRMAANLMYDYLRYSMAEQKMKTALAGQQAVTEETLETIDFSETRRILNEAVQQLPLQRQRIFQLRQEGMSYEEIASGLGISVNTVRNQLVKSYQHVRQYLKAHHLPLVIFLYYLI